MRSCRLHGLFSWAAACHARIHVLAPLCGLCAGIWPQHVPHVLGTGRHRSSGRHVEVERHDQAR
jgi:hypothetical protein